MATTIIKTPVQRLQNRIYNTLHNGDVLPKVTFSKEVANGDIVTIWIKHPQEYVPNIKMVWCANKEHYRVYIHVASTSYGKTNAGYCICTIANGYAATGFLTLYGFLVNHRANNRSEAN